MHQCTLVFILPGNYSNCTAAHDVQLNNTKWHRCLTQQQNDTPWVMMAQCVLTMLCALCTPNGLCAMCIHNANNHPANRRRLIVNSWVMLSRLLRRGSVESFLITVVLTHLFNTRNWSVLTGNENKHCSFNINRNMISERNDVYKRNYLIKTNTFFEANK